MNINRARFVDHWIGVFLCFLLSVWERIRRIFRDSKTPFISPKKILFLKLSELGAIILSYPLMKKIREKYPTAELYYLTFDKNQDIFKLLGGMIPEKNIFTVRENAFWILFDAIKVIRKMRQEGIEVVLDLEFFSRVSAILSYLSRAKKRIGFYRYDFEGLYRGDLLTHRVFYNPLNHVTRSYLSLAFDLESESKATPEFFQNIADADIVLPQYHSGDLPREAMMRDLRSLGMDPEKSKIFLVNPGEGMLPLREWPIENFIEVSKKILEHPDHWVVLTGTAGAERKTEPMRKLLNHPRCVSMIGKTSLEGLMELFCLSRALISNDCGLVHLAMLTKIEKFVLFGPESPQIFGPFGEHNHIFYSKWPCSPCLSAMNHRESHCVSNECLKAITAHDVLSQLEILL